jgi:soluble lytic murein transglycosylase-like protein
MGELLSIGLLACILLGLFGMVSTAGLAEEELYAEGECQVSASFPKKVRKWCPLITRYAREAGLSPDLIAALILQESEGNPNAYSHSGAVGLMQVMPRDGLAASFRCRGGPCFQDRPTIAELKDPEFNVSYGTRMLARLARIHKGDLREALRAYGPMDVGYRYADIVLSLYKKYRRP